MNYQLYREGKELEHIRLDELQRRRQSGELKGDELVWCEGMADWQGLDSVLRSISGDLPEPTAPPILPAKRKPRSKVFLPLTALICLIGVVGMIWLSRSAVRIFQQVKAGNRSEAAGEAEAVAIAQQPITMEKKSQTQSDVTRRARQFRIRQYLEGYKLRGNHDPLVDNQVEEFLNTWIAVLFGGDNSTNYTQSPELLGDKLAADPRCTDPLVLTILAANTSDLLEKRRRLDRALQGYAQSKHKGYPKFYAAVSQSKTLSANSPNQGPLDVLARQFLQEAFTDGSFLPEDQAEVADVLVNNWGASFFKQNGDLVCQMAKDSGRKFEWLALVLEGENHITWAWRARGGGYADTVTEEGWKGFNNNLELARKAFTRAWKQYPELPLASERMIYVALGSSDLPEMRLWFDRALAAQIDCPGAWSNLRWGLRPRWFGNLEATRELGIAAIKTGRFDTDVPRKFFDCVSDLESELQLAGGEHIYGREDIWPWMEKMYEGYIDAAVSRETANGWRSAYSIVAFLAGKYEVARGQMQAMNWTVRPENLSGWGVNLALLPEQIAALTSPARAEVETAESQRANGRLADALKGYRSILASSGDERVMAFASHRIAGLEFEQRLAKGDWLDFLPSGPADTNWVFAMGKAERLADGTLEVRSGPEGHMFYSLARIGGNFEVKGEFELAGSTTPDFQAGLVFGFPNPNGSDWYSFRMRQNSREKTAAVIVAPRWTWPQIRRSVAFNAGRNEFEFRFQDGRATATINGAELIRRGRLSTRLNVPLGESLLGIGAYNDGNRTVIHYRKLQVRRLSGTKDGAGGAGEQSAADQGE